MMIAVWMILRKNKCKQKSPVPNGAGDFYVVKLINKFDFIGSEMTDSSKRVDIKSL